MLHVIVLLENKSLSKAVVLCRFFFQDILYFAAFLTKLPGPTAETHPGSMLHSGDGEFGVSEFSFPVLGHSHSDI